MNAVEQAVRTLGHTIQADERYKAYEAAKKSADADTELQQKIQEFNLKRMTFQQEVDKPDALRNQERLNTLESQVQAIYEEILANSNMVAFQTAKEAMDGMMQQIDQIITLCANGENPDTCHPDLSNCTGNCASCGGCH